MKTKEEILRKHSLVSDEGYIFDAMQEYAEEYHQEKMKAEFYEGLVAKTETETGKLVDMTDLSKIDREHFTDNIDFLEVLTEWCIRHGVSFNGLGSSIITSAVNEYLKSKINKP